MRSMAEIVSSERGIGKTMMPSSLRATPFGGQRDVNVRLNEKVDAVVGLGDGVSNPAQDQSVQGIDKPAAAVDEQADPLRPALHQGAGEPVGLVVEDFHGLAHPGRGPFGDVGPPVDNMGNGADGYLGKASDVFQRSQLMVTTREERTAQRQSSDFS